MDESGQGHGTSRGGDVEGQSFAVSKSQGDSAFNLEIIDDLEGLRRFDVADRVSDTCDNILSKLKHRNKLLLVADSSPWGWQLRSQYEKPLLGSDSEDERHLRHAEARAVKKIKSSSSLSDSILFHPYKSTSTYVPRATGSSTPQTTSQMMPQCWGSGVQQSFRDYRPSTCWDIGFVG